MSGRRAKVAEGGEVAQPGDVIIPPGLAERLARELATGWGFTRRSRDVDARWRPDPEMGELHAVLGRARLVAELCASDVRSDVLPGSQGGLMTAADLAARYGVTPDRITQRCRRGDFPGAHQVGTVWLIPDPDQERP